MTTSTKTPASRPVPPPLDAELEALLRRMRLPHIRNLSIGDYRRSMRFGWMVG